MYHDLKCWTHYWDEINHGRKTFEVRSTKDRVFQAGDVLNLQSWNQKRNEYDGRPLLQVFVTAVYHDLPGLESGHCVMSISLKDPATVE